MTRRNKWRWRILFTAFPLLCFGVSYWWYLGGQHWLAIHTGTCPVEGSCNSGTGPYYGYWSGFGSVWPWSFLGLSGVAGVLAVTARRHNCHEPGCWRIGRVHVDDKGTLSCFHHHPEGKPQKGHILRKHREHQERLRVALSASAGTERMTEGK